MAAAAGRRGQRRGRRRGWPRCCVRAGRGRCSSARRLAVGGGGCRCSGSDGPGGGRPGRPLRMDRLLLLGCGVDDPLSSCQNRCRFGPFERLSAKLFGGRPDTAHAAPSRRSVPRSDGCPRASAKAGSLEFGSPVIWRYPGRQHGPTSSAGRLGRCVVEMTGFAPLAQLLARVLRRETATEVGIPSNISSTAVRRVAPARPADRTATPRANGHRLRLVDCDGPDLSRTQARLDGRARRSVHNRCLEPGDGVVEPSNLAEPMSELVARSSRSVVLGELLVGGTPARRAARPRRKGSEQPSSRASSVRVREVSSARIHSTS